MGDIIPSELNLLRMRHWVIARKYNNYFVTAPQDHYDINNMSRLLQEFIERIDVYRRRLNFAMMIVFCYFIRKDKPNAFTQFRSACHEYVVIHEDSTQNWFQKVRSEIQEEWHSRSLEADELEE